MKPHQATLIYAAASLLFVGCASPPAPRARPQPQTEARRVERRLHEIFDAAAKQDMPRLDSYHLYGPSFTKFAPEHAQRLDAAAARAGEHKGLMAVSGLSMQAEELKIDLFGDTAVATFILNYSFTAGNQTVHKRDRTTLVLVKDHGDWKIVHEHLSPLKSEP